MARIPSKKATAFRMTVHTLSETRWSAKRIAQQINRLRFLGKVLITADDIRQIWKEAGSRAAFVREPNKRRRTRKKQ